MRGYPAAINFLLRLGISPRLLLLVGFDLLSLVGTMLCMLVARAAFGGVEADIYHWVLPLLTLSPVLGISLGLYRALGEPPHKLLRDIFLFVSMVYGLILAVLFLSKTGDLYSRMIIMGSWAATLAVFPLMRAMCTRIFSRFSWWCREVVIFDAGTSGHHYWLYLKKHPELCLLPVRMCRLKKIEQPLDWHLRETARAWPGAFALVLPGDRITREKKPGLVAEISRHFSNVLIVPDFEEGFRRCWLTPCQLGGVTALYLNQNLHDRRKLRFKRCLDVFFCILAMPVLVPLGILLSVFICLDSRGPVFYLQKRVGRHGKPFRVIKFRTMVKNADAVLDEYLKKDSALKTEWERDHKLRHDPRLTRAGHFLRKTSLDELPQIINVLHGSMSLVGPRPIVEREIKKYGPVFDEYCRVRPGLTGLWQISGRNNTTYAERVDFDHYYVNNWSVWLDIWILVKTIPAALRGNGAY